MRVVVARPAAGARERVGVRLVLVAGVVAQRLKAAARAQEAPVGLQVRQNEGGAALPEMRSKRREGRVSPRRAIKLQVVPA